MFFVSINFAQSNWSEKEKQVAIKFGLDTSDHRGAILKSEKNLVSISETDLIENFFISLEKQDIVEIQFPVNDSIKEFLNRPLDIHELVMLYIKLSK